jgi:hypothetical protein
VTGTLLIERVSSQQPEAERQRGREVKREREREKKRQNKGRWGSGERREAAKEAQPHVGSAFM